MTLVLSAFAGELAACIEVLQDKKKSKISLGTNREIYYTYGLTKAGEKVTAAVAGIGKLNSYISTLELIKECLPDRVVFIGISGAVAPELKIGDVVLSESITQYDIDYFFDKILPGGNSEPMKGLILTDKNLTDEIDNAFRIFQKHESSQRTLAGGCTGSADLYMTPEVYSRYMDVLTRREVLSVDMEGFSAAAAAQVRNIPFAQIRIISDGADGVKPDASDFRKFLRNASKDLASIIVEMKF